jgi:peptidyl-prolyl cis-trans isomerase D
LEELKSGVAWEPAVKKLGLTPRSSGFLKRNDPIGDLGSEPEMLRIAFERSGSNPLPTEPIQTAKGYSVIRFRERQAPDLSGFEKERNQIMERLLQQKKSRTWQAWMSQLRDRSRVDQKRDFNTL